MAFTPLGIWLALTFIGLPFVVRTVQPVLEDLDKELEEAAASLGASRGQTIRRVIFPMIWPSLLTGFSLAFARALGEYGSVVFISGNMPMRTEITPLLIITKLEQYDYTGATSIAVVMLVVSFLLLLSINGLEAWSQLCSAGLLLAGGTVSKGLTQVFFKGIFNGSGGGESDRGMASPWRSSGGNGARSLSVSFFRAGVHGHAPAGALP